MSEYQYYEFRAIDRPLTKKQVGELRRYSSRAEITATSFSVEYNWVGFKGNPHQWMEKYFQTKANSDFDEKNGPQKDWSWSPLLRQRSMTIATLSATADLASKRSRPFARRRSYSLCVWRTCALTARSTASTSNPFAAAERPTRPLCFWHACRAMASASSPGHAG